MPNIAETETLWSLVKSKFKERFSPEIFDLWFEPLVCIEAGDDKVVLGTPYNFATIWIQDNYLDHIRDSLRMAAGRTLDVELRQVEPAADSGGHNRLEAVKEPERPPAAPAPVRRTQPAARREYVLNPRNTFDSFVVGSNNQLAHAAAMAVAQAPAQAYNPLFVYGETGLGKTHLMHAVGHQIIRQNEEAKVAYISSEKFTNEFIHAIQENTLTSFRRRYRGVDILLIDDIHFLSGKERSQEEFFHTFNDLFESQKQIVLSSDRPASDIARLENRLVSRFQWGLVVDIQVPDFETRVAILRNKANSLGCLDIIPPSVIEFMAERISKNVRRLEGALIRVSSYANLTGQKIDHPTVENLLKETLQEEAQQQITVENIQKRVVEYYHLRVSDMVSRRRPNNIAFPRQIAMFLCRTLTRFSLQEIGEAFGGRDHGTVIHACRTVENMMEQDESVRNSVDYLKNQITRHPF